MLVMWKYAQGQKRKENYVNSNCVKTHKHSILIVLISLKHKKLAQKFIFQKRRVQKGFRSKYQPSALLGALAHSLQCCTACNSAKANLQSLNK